MRRELIYGGSELERAVAEVRFADGIYSYIYAVSSSPYFPGTSCCRAGIVNFAVTGHPLEQRWGAINGSDVYWTALEHPSVTRLVDRIMPLDDGFVVVPVPSPRLFTVVYMQSPLRPASKGTLTYTGWVRDWDQGGIVRIESFSRDDVLVPTPEPGSIVLFGLGLAGLAARRYARRHRGTAESL